MSKTFDAHKRNFRGDEGVSLDEGIKELVLDANRRPYLFTINSSCEGHFYMLDKYGNTIARFTIDENGMFSFGGPKISREECERHMDISQSKYRYKSGGLGLVIRKDESGMDFKSQLQKELGGKVTLEQDGAIFTETEEAACFYLGLAPREITDCLLRDYSFNEVLQLNADRLRNIGTLRSLMNQVRNEDRK